MLDRKQASRSLPGAAPTCALKAAEATHHYQRLDVSLPIKLVVEEREVCGIATSLGSGSVFICCDDIVSQGSFATTHISPEDKADDSLAEARVVYQGRRYGGAFCGG